MEKKPTTRAGASLCDHRSFFFFKQTLNSHSKKRNLGLTSLFLFLSIFFAAAQITVNSASQFNNLNLSPGDVVTWTNGTYSNQNINFIANGTATNPIILKAETPGGVKFTGSSQLNFSGEHLIVEGFFWDGGTGTSNHVEFRREGSSSDLANNCTIRNCAFDDLSTSGDDKSRWIVLYGRNNTVENCSFLNKRSTGACILVELRYQSGGVAGHQIRNNYFYNFPSKDGRTNSNDSEGMRIGTSSFQTVNAGVTVQGNYFREVDGENEIISNKSKGNIFRNNTFRKCRGSLVLRHGAQATVDGNYFLGENKAKSGGIRISDSDHTVINNYMQGLSNGGDSFNNGITLMGGNAASGGTSNGYQNVANIVVAFNTIYNSDDPIHFNDSKGTTEPQGQLANNLVYSTNGTLVSGDISQIGGSITYSGNIFGGSPIGISDNGITNANGNFSASGEIFKPSSSGPAANAATGSFSQVSQDVEGRGRPSSNKDVGAHEVSGGSGTATSPIPLTNSTVGDTIGACFLTASGSANTCSSAPPADALSVSSVSEFTASAGTKTATITSNLSWSVTDNQSWITVTPTSGTNNGTISIAVTENTSSTTRTGTVTVSGGSLTRTVSISQAGVSTPPPSGDNIALNKNVTATGTADGTNVPANVVDGSTGTRWSSSGFPKSFTIDLGDVYAVERTEMVCYQDRAYQYVTEVATSASGPFQQIVNRSSNTTPGTVASPINDAFTATNARYVRVTVSGAAVYTGTWVSILEFRVFGELVGSGTVPVTDVSLTPTNASIEVGNSTQLSASVSPSNATDTSVSYSSSNTGIVTVNASGQVTAIAAGQATITVTTNDGGLTDTAVITVTAPQNNTLPAPWETQDIGAVGATGSASFSNGTFTIGGSGADIWGTADEFRYVYQPFSGDVTITARVVSVENTNSWAKSGVMIRDDLTTGSKHAMTVVTPGQGVSFQRRTSNNGSSAHTTTGGISAPYWVRIQKAGSVFTSSVSSDGSNWTTLGTQTFNMGTSLFVGLAVTSHNDGVLCTSNVDNVSVVFGTPTANCTAGSNVASNTTIASFSAQQSANPASNILDGNTSNRWSAQGFPQNAVIDLGDTYSVNEINLHPFQNRAYQFLVEGSTTSATSGFTTLTDARQNTAGGSIISRSFTAQSVRYVRLTITGASGYSGVWTSIREFEVLCAGSTARASANEETIKTTTRNGVTEDSIVEGIDFHPNPFRREITLRIAPELQKEVTRIRLVDPYGRLILETQNIRQINRLSVPSSLSKGLYILQLLGNEGNSILSKKVLKN